MTVISQRWFKKRVLFQPICRKLWLIWSWRHETFNRGNLRKTQILLFWFWGNQNPVFRATRGLKQGSLWFVRLLLVLVELIDLSLFSLLLLNVLLCSVLQLFLNLLLFWADLFGNCIPVDCEKIGRFYFVVSLPTCLQKVQQISLLLRFHEPAQDLVDLVTDLLGLVLHHEVYYLLQNLSIFVTF